MLLFKTDEIQEKTSIQTNEQVQQVQKWLRAILEFVLWHRLFDLVVN